MNMYKCGINNPVYYPFFYTVKTNNFIIKKTVVTLIWCK